MFRNRYGSGLGFNNLGEIMEMIPNFQFTTLNTDQLWAEKNRLAVVRFLKAFIRGLRWIRQNPNDAAILYANEMGMKQPYAQQGIEYFTKNQVFPIDGSITLEGLRVNLQVLARDGLISDLANRPRDFVIPTFLYEAQKQLQAESGK